MDQHDGRKAAETPPWNHNIAYYRRIGRWTADCRSILDVGCGNGLLAAYLDNGTRDITGIDIDGSCIARAVEAYGSARVRFICGDFLGYGIKGTYDAVVFVASIHHTDMAAAINKAKTLLSDKGRIIVVGLATPSNLMDYMVEAMRIIPCAILTAIRHARSSEDLGIPVSYDLPAMSAVRHLSSTPLPRATLRYGLYYRYLLRWTNR